jgi:hypothetical protein
VGGKVQVIGESTTGLTGLVASRQVRYNSLRYDRRESGLHVRGSSGAPSTLPDLPEHAENHAGMAQRFLRAAIEKNRGQNQKNDRSLAGESSTEPLKFWRLSRKIVTRLRVNNKKAVSEVKRDGFSNTLCFVWRDVAETLF